MSTPSLRRIPNRSEARLARRTRACVRMLALLPLLALAGCGEGAKPSNEAVLFTSLDPVFSEPLVREYEQQSGVTIKLTTDAEAAKTVGLVNRLIARREFPEADVFWNNELGQTLVLKRLGILEPYRPEAAAGLPESVRDPEGYWTGFAARARVILYHTQLLKAEEAPRRVEDLALPRFKGKLAMARPLFGTTFTHMAVLHAGWGEERLRAFFRALRENEVRLAAGNAMARNLVADGEVAVCLTDTDDAQGALQKGRPVEMIYPDQDGEGAVVIPNSVALIKGGPHPEQAKRLIEFLVSAQVEARLAQGESAQMPLRPGVPAHSERFRIDRIKAREIHWEQVAERFEKVKALVERELPAQ